MCFQKELVQTYDLRVFLANAAKKLRDAYELLVKKGIFMLSDILEKGACQYGAPLSSAELDPMGVLHSAITLARYVLTQKALQKSGGKKLDERVRVALAGILFMSYKLRSESNFGTLNVRNSVLATFLTKTELESYNASCGGYGAERAMNNVEQQLLVFVPLWEVIDNNPFTGNEFAVYEMFEEQLISEHEMYLMLGSAFFYYYCAACCTSSSLLEELGANLTAEDIGRAIALLGLSTIEIMRGGSPREIRNSNLYGSEVSRAAARLVTNACEIESRMSVRTGAYAGRGAVSAMVSRHNLFAIREAFA